MKSIYKIDWRGNVVSYKACDVVAYVLKKVIKRVSTKSIYIVKDV